VGDYELLGEIARGGMGVVYRARQIGLERDVALKMILVGHWASEAQVQRFRLEAQASARLEHPNIVPVYDFGEHEGWHFFSLKLIEGEDLARQLRAGQLAGDKSSPATEHRATRADRRRGRSLRASTRHSASRSQTNEHSALIEWARRISRILGWPN
jgi:serine/threonine protein kinase